jgi:hypothetical protein
MRIKVIEILNGSEYEDVVYEYFIVTILESSCTRIEILACPYSNPLRLYKDDTIDCLINIVPYKIMRIGEETSEPARGCTRLSGRVNTKQALPDKFPDKLHFNDKISFSMLETKDGTFISYSGEMKKYKDGDEVVVDVPLFTLEAWRPVEHGLPSSHFRVQMHEIWRLLAETMKDDNEDVKRYANAFLFDLFLHVLDPVKDHSAIPKINAALDVQLAAFRDYTSICNGARAKQVPQKKDTST